MTDHMEPPKKRVRKPNWSPDEKMMLAALYSTEKDLYESQYKEASKAVGGALKWKLLQNWSQTISALGVSQRSPAELEQKIRDYRNSIRKYNSSEDSQLSDGVVKKIRPLSPAATVFNTVWEQSPELNGLQGSSFYSMDNAYTQLLNDDTNNEGQHSPAFVGSMKTETVADTLEDIVKDVVPEATTSVFSTIGSPIVLSNLKDTWHNERSPSKDSNTDSSKNGDLVAAARIKLLEMETKYAELIGEKKLKILNLKEKLLKANLEKAGISIDDDVPG